MKQLFRFVEIWKETNTFAEREFQELRRKIEFKDEDRMEQDQYTDQLIKLQRQIVDEKKKCLKTFHEKGLTISRLRRAEKDNKEQIQSKNDQI